MARKRKQQQQQQQQPQESTTTTADDDHRQVVVVVLPGDDVTKHILVDHNQDKGLEQVVGDGSANIIKKSSTSSMPKIGTGLRYVAGDDENSSSSPTTQQQQRRILATTAGRLVKHRNKPVWYVQESVRRYYRPRAEDRVIGIVEDRVGSDGKGGDIYRVNINSSHPATLCNLQFEGATKRNKPSLHPGQLLYARVMDNVNDIAGRFLDPVLSCQLGPHDGGIPRKDWMTNEGCYGELKGGTVCRISTGLALQLLKPDNMVLSEIASPQNNNKIQFEIAVGVNGYLWIHSSRHEYTIMIQNAILNSEVLTPGQVRAMVKSLVYTVQKQIQQERDAMEE